MFISQLFIIIWHLLNDLKIIWKWRYFFMNFQLWATNDMEGSQSFIMIRQEVSIKSKYIYIFEAFIVKTNFLVQRSTSSFPCHDASAFAGLTLSLSLVDIHTAPSCKLQFLLTGNIKSPQESSRRTFWLSELQLCICHTPVPPSARHAASLTLLISHHCACSVSGFVLL